MEKQFIIRAYAHVKQEIRNKIISLSKELLLKQMGAEVFCRKFCQALNLCLLLQNLPLHHHSHRKLNLAVIEIL